MKQTGFHRAAIEYEGTFMLDRLLIAHAILHGCEIATTDRRFMEYPVRLVMDLW